MFVVLWSNGWRESHCQHKKLTCMPTFHPHHDYLYDHSWRREVEQHTKLSSQSSFWKWHQKENVNGEKRTLVLAEEVVKHKDILNSKFRPTSTIQDKKNTTTSPQSCHQYINNIKYFDSIQWFNFDSLLPTLSVVTHPNHHCCKAASTLLLKSGWEDFGFRRDSICSPCWWSPSQKVLQFCQNLLIF